MARGDLDLTARLSLDAGLFERQAKSAAQSASVFEKELGKLDREAGKARERVGQFSAVIGAGLLAGIGATVRAASAFSKEMSGVAAVSGATAKELDALREAALKAGADTAFSASDAARAQAELARAGVSTADILGGALRGSLDLAAAGQLELADAATISAQAMNIFKLEGSDVGHVADVLAAAANKSAADVKSLGDGLRQGGLVAAQTGLSLEETVAALSAFSDSALVGSDAGTSLKTMLGSLTPNSKAAKNEMDDLGFSAFDAAGNFIGLEALAGELQTSFRDLTVEQRAASMETIFGSDAVRAANVLYERGAAGIAEYVTAVNDQGAAQRMAKTQLDNLAGDLEALSGSLETAAIKSGSALEGLGRTGVQSATNILNAYNELPAALQTGVTYFGLFAGAVTAASGAFILATPKVNEFRKAADEMGGAAARVNRGLGATASFLGGPWGLAIGAAVVGIGLFGKAKADAAREVEQYVAALEADSGALSDNTRELVINRLEQEGLLGIAQELGVDLESFTDAVLGNADAQAAVRRELAGYIDVSNVYGDTLSGQAGDAQTLTEALNGESAAVSGAVESYKRKQQAMDGTTESTEQLTPAQEAATAAIAGMDEASEGAAEALDALDKALQAVLDRSFGVEEASDSLEAQFDELTEAAKKNGRELDNNSEKGRANRAQIRDLVGGVFELVDAQAKNGASSEELQATVERERARFVDLATQLGFNREEVDRYAGALDEVPGLVESTFTTPGADQARQKVFDLQKAVQNLLNTPGMTDVVATSLVKQEQAMANRRGGDGPGFNTGGPVWGAGSATSDSIPAYLSNGEYVIKADSVAKYGQGFFDAVNAGRFAGGGRVGATIPIHIDADRLGGTLGAAVDQLRAMLQPVGGGGVGLAGQPMGVQTMMRIINSEFGQTRLISGQRAPGSKTATGRTSYHGMGRAVDLPPNMALFNFLRGRFPNARELIYSPAGGRQINNGRPHVYSGVTKAMHYDHIHLAMRNGGLVGRGPRRMAAGGPVRLGTPGVLAATGSGVSPERATWHLVEALHEAERLTDINAREQAALTALREADARWAWSAANAAQAQRDVDKDAAYRELVAAGRLGEVARGMLAKVEAERYDNMLRTGSAEGLRGVLATYQERIRLAQEEAREVAILADLREADAKWAWSANNLANAGRDEDREAAIREMQQAGEQGERAREQIRELQAERTRAADVARIESAIAAAESRERLAANRAEYEFGRMSTGEQLNDLRRRIKAEQEFSDEWMRLVAERDRLEQDVQQKREQRRDDAARDLNAALDQVQQVRARLAESEARMRESVQGIRAQLAADTSRMMADRAESLLRGDLTQRVSVAWGNSVMALRRNVMDQVGQFSEWMKRLADARSRGVSETTIRALGLDAGPEALGQLRMFGQATRDEIESLNQAVASREQLANNQARGEAKNGVTRLGEDLIAAREQANEQIAKLSADFAVEQRAARDELAAIGKDQGRSYADAVREGMASGLPAIRDMARELRLAAGGPIRLAGPAQSQTVIVQLDGQTIARSTTTWQQRQNRVLRMRAGA